MLEGNFIVNYKFTVMSFVFSFFFHTFALKRLKYVLSWNKHYFKRESNNEPNKNIINKNTMELSIYERITNQLLREKLNSVDKHTFLRRSGGYLLKGR